MHAFHACSLGLADIENEHANQHLDENARDWIKVIQSLMNTDSVEDPTGEGAWVVKARTLTTDDRIQLSRCVDELAHWFDMYEDRDAI